MTYGLFFHSPHLYALQHTMSDSTLGTKTNQFGDGSTYVERTNLKNVCDHQRTPHLQKRNRISSELPSISFDVNAHPVTFFYPLPFHQFSQNLTSIATSSYRRMLILILVSIWMRHRHKQLLCSQQIGCSTTGPRTVTEYW